MIDLSSKSIMIFGLKGSGKTVLTNFLADNNQPSLIVDTTKHDYPKTKGDRYLPTHTQYSDEAISEMNTLINKKVLTKKYSFFAIDELNNFAPSMRLMPSAMVKLNEETRHIPITFCGIARRPASINNNLVEVADYLVFFRLVGKNDIIYLDSIKEGLGDTVKKLKDFCFVLLNPRREVEIFKPIPFKK
jgi:hypothetical protein